MFRIFIDNQQSLELLGSTINISNRTNFERSLSASFGVTQQNFVRDGSEVEVFEQNTSVKLFGGIVTSYSSSFMTPLTEQYPLIQVDISSDGYGIIPQRRIVNVSYTNTNIRTIVLAMLDILDSETIVAGTIAAASTLESINYTAKYKSIADVLTELAEASGHVWYIDNSRRLHFVPQQGISSAPYAIDTQTGTFRDFSGLSWSGSLDNYANKVFVVYGDPQTSATFESASEIAIRQTEAGGQGTGVYGFVIEDSNVQSAYQASTVANAHLKNYAVTPGQISFSTYTKGFAPAQQIQVRSPQITGYSQIPPRPVNTWYYLIDEVTTEIDSNQLIKYNISATRRNSGNFSTQKSAGFTEYFKKITKG